jgi:membrane-associated phospholipid phosphatase
MSDVLQWGLDFIVAVQEFRGPVLDGVFRTITFLGDEEFYLLLLPLLFWSINVRKGAHLGIVLMLSVYLNTVLKDWFQQGRPFDYDPSVKVIDEEGYGLPSGHAQWGVVVWGMLASWARKTWAWVAVVTVMILIGFSRVYLGVHFPTQVLTGWAIGAVSLGLYLIVYADVEKWLIELRLGQQIALALVVPLALLLAHPVKHTVTATATLVGLGVGLALAQGRVVLDAGGPWRQRAARFLIGVVVLFGVFFGLKAVFPDEGESLYLALRFVRYGFVGMWASLGAPWLFGLLGLTPKD